MSSFWINNVMRVQGALNIAGANGAVVAPRGPSCDAKQQSKSKHTMGSRNVWLQGRESTVSRCLLWIITNEKSLSIVYMWIHDSWRVFL